jgi:hypothetical protein
VTAREGFSRGPVRTVLDDHELELGVEIKNVLWPPYRWFWMARLIMLDRGKRIEFEGFLLFHKDGG